MKINSKSRVMPTTEAEPDTIKRSHLLGCDRKRAWDVLMLAQQAYNNMYRYRMDRERNKRYNYGDQWSDVINVGNKTMTEESYIMEQGNIPLKNNLIRRLTRNVIGAYRQQSTEPTCIARDRDEQKQAETMSTVLQYNMQLNRMSEMYARTIEEFLIGGLVVHRKWFGWRNDKNECWTDYVNPNNFFIDTNMKDFRGWDCSLVGEIHDVAFEEVVQRYAKSPAEFEVLAEIYRFARDKESMVHVWEEFGFNVNNWSKNFLVPTDTSRCRVIEVWRKESKPRYRCHDYNSGDIYKIEVEDYNVMVTLKNAERVQRAVSNGMSADDVPLIEAEWFIDNYWYCYALSPFGDILEEYETPYDHKSHPYVFRAYPFLDGEIHSFVSDVIDQQRYVNRLITLYDWIMRASAKGVLLVPDECIPKNCSPEEFAETWTKFNGVVIYKAKQGVPAPQQIASNSTNIGINELLNIQLKFFEDISGVQAALQGKGAMSGMSASLYYQQSQNASTSLLDLLESFNEFVRDGAYKDVKNIQQFYDEKRVFNIAGRAASQVEYDPEKIKDVEFDLSIVPSTATPAYRAIANDFLLEIWRSGQASLEQVLQVGNFPFADELLQSIRTQKEQMEQGQVPEGVSPQLMQQAQAGADMGAVNALDGAMRQ